MGFVDTYVMFYALTDERYDFHDDKRVIYICYPYVWDMMTMSFIIVMN